METIQMAERRELLAASDETIEEAVAYADPMVLRGLLYLLTGDEELAATQSIVVPTVPFASTGLATEAEAALVRSKAVAFLKTYRDAGAGEVELGPPDRLPASVRLATGAEIRDEDMELWLEELALDRWARGLTWRKAPAPELIERFSVTVIGAGMGGLNAAAHLKRAGIPFTVLEKNADVGGTWFENKYPGCRVDTPSRSYMHILGVDYPLSSIFVGRDENLAYLNWIADTFDIRDDIEFDTEVRSLAWDEDASMWEIHIEGPDGSRAFRSNAVMTAVGFLSRPSMPDIEGMDSFHGPSWHTARWPEHADLRDKRVAVIGTGCTGYQLIPELALEAQHVAVFQRRPQWIFGTPGYRTPAPPQIGWLDRNLPLHGNFMRLRLTQLFEGFNAVAGIDPSFEDPHTVSAANKRLRDAAIEFLEAKLGDGELVAKMTPPHPPLSARPVLVDTEYSVLDAIQRANVTLVTDAIRRITPTGIETEGGVEHEVDVIVYATGFRAAEFLYPMSVVGRGGTTLAQLWRDGGARAYAGCMMPGFPNLWTLYGPNTNGGLNVPGLEELGTVHALQCIERLLLDDHDSVEVREEAYLRYNEDIDERNAHKVWADPRADNYYWTENGRSSTMCPLSGPEFWHALRRPKFEDLIIRRRRRGGTPSSRPIRT